MTRKDYVKTAEILRDIRPDGADPACKRYWRMTVEKFVTMFAEDNPNFDAVRFYKACGLQRDRAPEYREPHERPGAKYFF